MMADLTPDNIRNRVFTCFPKLPTELRLIIWKYSLPGPRILSVTKLSHDFHSPVSLSVRLPAGDVIGPMVAQLHTCSEARKLTLKRYRVIFERFGWSTYFDKKIDSIEIDADVELRIILTHYPSIKTDFCKVQNLIISRYRTWANVTLADQDTLRRWLLKFENLKSLTLKEDTNGHQSTTLQSHRRWPRLVAPRTPGIQAVNPFLAELWREIKAQRMKDGKANLVPPKVLILNAGFST